VKRALRVFSDCSPKFSRRVANTDRS